MSEKEHFHINVRDSKVPPGTSLRKAQDSVCDELNKHFTDRLKFTCPIEGVLASEGTPKQIEEVQKLLDEIMDGIAYVLNYETFLTKLNGKRSVSENDQ